MPVASSNFACCLCRAAQRANVLMTTADSKSELLKIAAAFPGAEVLLRIRQDDPSARCQLGNKYGAEPDDVQGAMPLTTDVCVRSEGHGLLQVISLRLCLYSCS